MSEQTALEAKGKARPRLGPWVLGLGGLIVVALVGSLVAVTLPRWRQQRELDAAAARAAAAPPRVAVTTARRAGPTSELTLPGNAQPFRGAALYARTNGYLQEWLVDIGDQVKEGQLLARISAPDVDDQLAQARANLVLARANLQVSEANSELAKITLKRNQESGVGVGVSALTIDQNRAQVETTAAQVRSAQASIQVNEATVRQYADLQSFQKIVAPFAGVITVRTVDPGALVTADNPSETRPLFYLMQTDPLRVFVNVPQVYATTVAVGQHALLYREEDPHRQFSGKVTRTANALDPNTRTLLTQIDVPNPKDALRPGMYLQVKFTVPRPASTVLVPGAALVWRPDGTVVAVTDSEQQVRYRKVQVGRDFGTEVEVVTGLEGGETIVVHPGDALPEGQQVEPVPSSR
jgi:RND family efflux transporter MFP subunit